MTDLRAALIDRLAVELHDQEGDIIEENYAVAAEFVLDAVLDVLADRAFDDQAFSDEPLVGVCLADHVALSGLSGLLAVLRGDS